MFEAQGWATNDDVRNRLYFFETMDGNSFFFFFVCLLLNIVQFVCLFLFNIITTSRGRTLLFLPKKKAMAGGASKSILGTRYQPVMYPLAGPRAI